MCHPNANGKPDDGSGRCWSRDTITLIPPNSLPPLQNESIGWELYNLDWPETLECDAQFREDYRSVRQAVLTVLEVAQQPLGLNCFGFFEFTQDRFWELLNMAYNFYTFLRNFV